MSILLYLLFHVSLPQCCHILVYYCAVIEIPVEYEMCVVDNELSLMLQCLFLYCATSYLQEPEAGYQHYRYGDQVDWGRMNQDFLSKALLPSDINPATFLLVCGTKSFENDMIEICRKLGLCDTQIHRF